MDALTRRVLDGPLPVAVQGSPLAARLITADLTAWLETLAHDLSDAEIAKTFAQRFAAHAAAGFSREDAVCLQHTYAAVLTRTLGDPAPPCADGPGSPPIDAAHLTRILARVIAVAERTPVLVRPSPGPRTPPDSTPRDASHQTARWCVAASCSADDIKPALRAFRAANPDALIAVTGVHVTAFTTCPPTDAAVLGPHGLVPVDNGDTTRAARRAALAAVIARYYGTDVKDEDATPLLAAVDLPATEREAYVVRCLGALHTMERNRHLLQTLAVYLAHNQCTAAAARSLFIHRHTLAYRLRAIATITGLDLDAPFDRMRAEMALLLSDANCWGMPRRRGASRGH
ncbi:helix-turn-helix domain-containing protein [Streptomyces sp. ISL-22]|uniref:PucR family transcriptional regulator n=1 Tax=unclassified Streptomyces TaxID=2593676 RepID=UPI001BE540E1|nr:MULTISPECIES: helix-turn-helix domain-containing protein [unclassified Streptomyces]MBT2420317.1 helix-turn-helix domain-containing protein [Streptomyces sp. ISL-24]MBT2433069.1 helix-turn-helix domain-containing protein [Streptomyces sp. ISL-22]